MAMMWTVIFAALGLYSMKRRIWMREEVVSGNHMLWPHLIAKNLSNFTTIWIVFYMAIRDHTLLI